MLESIKMFFVLKGYRYLVLRNLWIRIKHTVGYPYYVLKSRRIYRKLEQLYPNRWECYVKIKEMEQLEKASFEKSQTKVFLTVALMNYKLAIIAFIDEKSPKAPIITDEILQDIRANFAFARQQALENIECVEKIGASGTADLKAFIEQFEIKDLVPYEQAESLVDHIEAEYRKITYEPC